MAAAEQFPDVELLRLGRVVCQITTIDSNGKDRKGTGFHYGKGWVMTNAHVFQDVKDDKTMHKDVKDDKTMHKDVKDDKRMHSLMTDATFTFPKENYVFLPQKRTAFIHHLNLGPNPGPYNKNIAMIKLGKQYKCDQAGGDYEPEIWEKDEEKLLVELNPSDFADLPSPEPKDGEEVFGIHFGDGDNEEKFVRSKIIPITQTTIYTMSKLCYDNSKNAFPLASSGCPVMVRRDGKYRLAGLNFGIDRTEYALMWTEDIQGHIGHQVGASIISMFPSYFAQKGAEKNMIDQVSHDREKRLQEAKDRQLSMKGNLIEETSQSMELHDQKAEDKKVAIFHDKGKEALVKIAREYQLTIYLPDGEIIGKEDPAVE